MTKVDPFNSDDIIEKLYKACNTIAEKSPIEINSFLFFRFKIERAKK